MLGESADQVKDVSSSRQSSGGSKAQFSLADLAGVTLQDRYHIQKLIGTGGWSDVYLAEHLTLKRPVAVKVLKADLAQQPDKLQRFESEATNLSRLTHPYIAQILDYGVLENGRPYLVMEYLAGPNLAEYLRVKEHLTPQEFQTTFQQILAALSAAHSAGFIHRDLKPSNLMFAANDGKDIKLLDFGLAKAYEQKENNTEVTTTGEVMGTPQYMSPEQINGRVLDQRSDIYSLACIMFECAIGKKPFESLTSFELMVKHCNEAPPAMAPSLKTNGYPQALEDIVYRCLEKEPAVRLSTQELVAALNDLWSGDAESLRKYKRKSSSSKIIIAAVAGLGTLALVACLFAIRSLSPGIADKSGDDKKPDDTRTGTERIHKAAIQGRANRVLDELEKQARAKYPPDAPEIISLQFERAANYERSFQPEKGEQVYRAVVSAVSERAGKSSTRLMEPLAKLRALQFARQDFKSALETDKSRLDIFEHNHLSNMSTSVDIHLALANDFIELKDIPEAQKQLDAIKKILKKGDATILPEYIAMNYALQGLIAAAAGQKDEAEHLAKTAYDLASGAQPNFLTDKALDNAAAVYRETGRKNKELMVLRRIYEVDRVLDYDSDARVFHLLRMAELNAEQEKWQVVERNLKRFPRIANAVPTVPNGNLKKGLELYALALENQGKTEEAANARQLLKDLSGKQKSQNADVAPADSTAETEQDSQ